MDGHEQVGLHAPRLGDALTQRARSRRRGSASRACRALTLLMALAQGGARPAAPRLSRFLQPAGPDGARVSAAVAGVEGDHDEPLGRCLLRSRCWLGSSGGAGGLCHEAPRPLRLQTRRGRALAYRPMKSQRITAADGPGDAALRRVLVLDQAPAGRRGLGWGRGRTPAGAGKAATGSAG